MQLDDWDKILSDVDLEEEKDHTDDWWCSSCEHGPMTEKETKCSRCGTKNGKVYNEEPTGWEDEDIESEVEEIY
jgi:uncharacterized paraquat-inducible protein A